MASDQLLSAEGRRKISPRLQVILDGDAEVNFQRARSCSALRVTSPSVRDRVAKKRRLALGTFPDLKKFAPPKEGKLEAIAKEPEVNVFLRLTSDPDPVKDKDLLDKITMKGSLAYAHVSLSEVDKLAKHRCVSHVEMPEAVKPPSPQIVLSDDIEDAIKRDDRKIEAQDVEHHNGKDVLIGVIDVQGFDFSHPDFQDENGTRFHRIWDQGAEGARPHPTQKSHFDYGSEFRKEHLEAAIRNAGTLGIPAYEIEKQSQVVPGSHGTHVASIAAGNHGICRAAKIAAVLISLPEEDYDRRRSFCDSSRIAHAVEYLFALKEELGCKAVSINISLGTNGHAHDGSSAVNRWIDSELTLPGRSVCIAAGNAGQEAPKYENDIGFIMGRIHTGGSIPAANLTKDITLQVVGNTIQDVSENELEIWYSSQDRFEVSLRPPDYSGWIGPIKPGKYKENYQLDDGTFVSIYNDLYHPANGSNYIAVYLSPYFGSIIKGVKPGVWTVRLQGAEVRDGRFHGWIERDDPDPLIKDGPVELWSFPSFFTPESNVDESSVSSLSCGHNVISVANLDKGADIINPSSSEGPTRDGRPKPDVAAPGTKIAAACGFDDEREWIGMSGTSMASPFVAGVVGLMLSVDSTLTAAQIGGIIRCTASPLPGADFNWRKDAGYGEIIPTKCVSEAALANKTEEVIP
jgi:subtilisin family serine protease